MEINQHGFLENLLSVRRENLETLPSLQTEISEILSNGWNFDCFDEFDGINTVATTLPPNSSYPEFPCSSIVDQDFNNHYFNEISCRFGNDDHFFTPPFTDNHFSVLQFTAVEEDPTPMPLTEDDQEMGVLPNHAQDFVMPDSCKVEPIGFPEVPVFNIGSCPERKVSGKKFKLEGKPSKNLMAERRRRKRLNDRLSMLRSIVPKISKMDRTSIVGDTINYVKELLERINSLQEEIEVGSNQLSILNNAKANELTVQKSPKFEVERRNEETKIEISCAAKPGLLLSAVTTLEALGLEVQQCVISCFNDFALRASCPEDLEKRKLTSCEDIKQALFRSAGNGGRCP